MAVVWRKRWLYVLEALAIVCAVIAVGLMAAWWVHGNAFFLKLAALYALAAVVLLGLWGLLTEMRRMAKRGHASHFRKDIGQR